MAQMNKHRLTLALCALLAAGAAHAAQAPTTAIAAEGRGDWAAAAKIYRDALRAQPDDAALWRRLSEVEARQKHVEAAAQALDKAAALAPRDAEAQAEDSHAWSVAAQPRKALAAIQRALALAPDNVDYLLAQSQLANWTGDYALAEKSLARMHALAPQRTDVLAAVARSAAWRGDLSGAIGVMRQYLEKYPQDKDAWIDLARFHAWRGDYPGAAESLADYRKRFGEDEGERALLARVDAWAGWRHEALQLNTPLLAAKPDDYERNYTQAIALYQGKVPRQALPYVAQVQALKPDTKETADLVRTADQHVSSYVDVPLWRSWDSQDITIRHLQAGLDWWLADTTTVMLDAGWNRYGAPLDSPFASAGGADHVNESRLRVGLRHALDEDYALEGWIGDSHMDQGGGSTGIGSLALLAQPGDAWRWCAQLERDRVGISPLAASLGIDRNGGLVEGWWTPDLRWTLDAYARHDEYSDSNQRDEVAFALRRATVRNGWLNLDLGVSGQWFGFDRDPHDGYYAPSSYRRFALTGGAYFHISDDVGLGVQAALGVQRDETLRDWKSANDLSADLAIGIFRDWKLHLGAGYSQRRQESGGYGAHIVSLTLQRNL
ncbi:MAG TPA: tetratricopeptide repeat protein [Rudaea sp.]|nr:tetratricopeptide repeat protein [Rudaea sp.]